MIVNSIFTNKIKIMKSKFSFVSTILLVAILFFSCSINKKQILYNSYLVKHRKYNLEQIFNYPSDVNFWSAQDSATYQMIDTVKYRVKYSDL